jgi:uncharacterized YigZ family protein
VPSYLTVARTGTSEIEAKRSRFLGRVERVTTEEEARAAVERIRREHWAARHHCSAFVLGPEGSVQRSSDDGEPPGTAGSPILEVLRGRRLSDVVAVVTRYFGGVLLGAGGLVRAYGDAARGALDVAGVLERRLMRQFDVTVGHADAGRVEHALRTRGVAVLGADYGVEATLHVAVPEQDAPEFAAALAQLSGGVATATARGAAWVDARAEA